MLYELGCLSFRHAVYDLPRLALVRRHKHILKKRIVVENRLRTTIGEGECQHLEDEPDERELGGDERPD